MDELIKRLRELASIPEHCENVANCYECSKEDICLSFTNKQVIELATQAADAIEKLTYQIESLCETIDLYRELLGGHPDPRGADGEPGIKCVDLQRDCRMAFWDEVLDCMPTIIPAEEGET